MQTTHDNCWMYPNSRHDPVNNLQKNDSHSCALLTDRYKNVQSGIHSRESNSFIVPQNNVANSLQNDQHRTAATHWPTSTYFQSSYANNFYTQNAYASQTNSNLNLSQNTQSQQNCGMRYPQNHNINFTHVPSTSHVNTAISGSSENTPRIRVKDVFSLNNNSLHDLLISSNSHQIHSKKQDDYITNYGRGSYNKTEITEAQSEFIDIQKLSFPQAGPPLSCTQRQQFCKPSNSVYQGSGEYSSGNQLQSGRSRVVEVDLGEKAQNPKTNSSDVSRGNIREKVIPNTPSAEINSLEVDPNQRLIQRTPILGSNIQQHNISINSEAHLLNHNSVTTSTNAPYQTNPNQTTHIYNQLNMPQTTVKITVPHTGESNLINMNPTLNTETSSRLSLPCLLESNNLYLSPGNKETSNQVSGKQKSFTLSLLQPVQENLNNNLFVNSVTNGFLSLGQNQPNTDNTSRDTVITSQKKITQAMEPLIDVNRENIIRFLNSTPPHTNIGTNNENVPRETVLQSTVLSNSLTPKRKNVYINVETAPDRSIPEENLFCQSIKMEEYNAEDIPDECFEEECEIEVSEEEKLLTASLTISSDNNEPLVGFTKVEDVVPPGELVDEPVDEDLENCAEESEVLENHSAFWSIMPTDKNCCPEQQEETSLNRNSYKSKINRDKLDMLIQFIKKDDEELIRPCSSRSPTNRISDNNKDKGEVDLNHNRRKLSKTSVVKNKNTSRETVSLMSHKIARVELLKSSSQSPESFSEVETNSDKSEEENTEDNMQYNPPQGNLTEKDNSMKSYSGNMNGSIKRQVEGYSSAKSQEGKHDFQEDRDVTNSVQDLQNLQAHFCMSCNLSSPISSFWINVVSAELRCLNCFKRMALKNDAINPKSKTSHVGGSDGNLAGKDKSNENVEKDTAKLRSEEKEKRQERVDSLDEQNKPEQSRKEKTIKSKHNGSKDDKAFERGKTYEVKAEKSGEQSAKKSNVKEGTQKVRSSENSSKSDICGKAKRKDSVSSEEMVGKPKSTSKENSTFSKSYSSNHSKQVLGYSEKKSIAKDKAITSSDDEVLGKSVRRSLSKEEEITDDRRNTKRVTDPAEKSGKRTKESHSSHKERNTEQSKSSKTKSQSPSKECCTCHKMKSSEQSNSSETKSKNTSSSNSEKVKQSRKRKNLEEGSIANKVRIVEDHSKRDIKQVQQPSDKSKVSKDETVSQKSKVLDNEKSKGSSEKSRRHSFPKEDEEHLKKDTKQVCDSSDKSKGAHHKIKNSESTKQKTNHSTNEKVGKKSKEDLESQKPVSSKAHTKSETKQSAESSRGHSRKNHGKEEPGPTKKEGKQGSFGTEAKEKEKREKEKQKKQFVGKIPKVSEKDKSENVGRPRKENGNKIKSALTSEKLKSRESQTEKKVKETTQKRSDAKAKKEDERSVDKKSAGKKTENRHAKDLTESSESRKRKKESATLFAELMKKTKKLSLTLLSEA